MKRVIVVGAGASGLMSAICAARSGASVTILEAMEKPGKKLLVTGNGKCNITNSDFSRKDCYRGAEERFVTSVLNQFTPQKTRDFFEELGLLLHMKNGGYYPVTEQAQSVLEILLLEAKKWKVKLKYQEKVLDVFKEESIWKVKTGSWCYEADSVILSCGSKAAPVTGSDGSGYVLAEKLGHKVIKPLPALVPLVSKEKWIPKLSGLRTKAKILMKITESSGRQLTQYTESGELQWTEYGVSGIVVFQLSRYAVDALENRKKVKIQMDVLPDISKEKLFKVLKERGTGTTATELLTGILPKKMIPVILDFVHLKNTQDRKQITDQQLEALVQCIKHLEAEIHGYRSYDQAQICMGGIDTNEIFAETLESKLHKNLYFTGELLNIDGMCGGYNLQWAWSSGYVAGQLQG